eukprot:UN03096
MNFIQLHNNLGSMRPRQQPGNNNNNNANFEPLAEYNIFNEKYVPYHKYPTCGNNLLYHHHLNHNGTFDEPSTMGNNCLYGAGLIQFDYTQLDNVLKYIRYSQQQPNFNNTTRYYQYSTNNQMRNNNNQQQQSNNSNLTTTPSIICSTSSPSSGMIQRSIINWRW